MRPIRDYSPDDYDAVANGPSRFARARRGVSTAVGAVVALALLLALGVWFYRLGVRDAENVPIIRASAEPTKTRPEQPGGVVAPYQDITSYGAAENGAPASAGALAAPPAPEPRPEDVAMGTLAPEPAARPLIPTAAGAGKPAASGSPVVGSPVVGPPVVDSSGADAVDGDEMPGIVAEPASEADEIAALVREATLDVATAPKPEPAVIADGASRSGIDPAGSAPLPAPRPSDLLARVRDSRRSAEASAVELTRRAAESPVQIQLAADPDEQTVRAMWRRISRANSDILHDRDLAVQSTVSGGATFYRLRVGPFSGMAEAEAVCQALKARGQDCIVARNG